MACNLNYEQQQNQRKNLKLIYHRIHKQTNKLVIICCGRQTISSYNVLSNSIILYLYIRWIKCAYYCLYRVDSILTYGYTIYIHVQWMLVLLLLSFQKIGFDECIKLRFCDGAVVNMPKLSQFITYTQHME